MNELHYQLDLLKAMNQKLTAKDKMYKMICDASNSAYLYYSFEKKEIVTMGCWQDFFDFEIQDIKDMSRILDEMREMDILPLRDALFLEKSGESEKVVECKLRDGNRWYSFRVNINYDDMGNAVDKLVVVENITKLRGQRDELIYMAHYDSMTGLYNRNYFVSLLSSFLHRAKVENSIVSVLVIDIDDFKKINDGMGIMTGDELIQIFGSFLKEFEDENTMVCHLNNDVYCMAIYNPVNMRSVDNIYKAMHDRTKKPFILSDGRSVNVTVSVGVAEYPEGADTPLELINCAEIVMYRCKANGKNCIQYFDAPMLSEFLNNIEMENKLKEAVFNSNFLLYYQPQFFTGTKRLRGVEALIRWRDEKGEMISPNAFIPIAEKNGCIVPIGSWVVDESIRQYSQWRKQYGIPFIMSINISAVQYCCDDFVDGLLNALKKYQVRPDEIEIEITESVLIEDFQKVFDKLKVLREAGVRVSLDDFGTGYSSLSYLKKLPIDTLKIDKSFIDTVLTDGATRIITESIINMVKALGVESIAEGVEDEAQYNYLHAIGCDMIQGFLLGKPQSPEDIDNILKNTL